MWMKRGELYSRTFCIWNLTVVPSVFRLSWTKPSTNPIRSDPIFKGIVQSVRDGNAKKQQADVIMKRRISQLLTE
jgi:hypothetical protein